MKNNNKGITLIELLIVISILAVLLTIAFFSYEKYTIYSRDSVRISDIKSLKTTLELYHIEASKFPKPDDSKEVTFNFDTVVWEQGTIGENLVSRLSRINKVPLDPRYENKYTYSLTADGLEYQIGSISEAGSITAYQPIITDVHAKTAANTNAFIEGNYNEVAILFKMTGLYVMYALPSIILPDLDNNIELSEMGTGAVVIKGKKCLPHSYKAYSDNCIIDFTPKLLFIGSNLPLTEEDIMAIVEQLKTIYSNPIFSVDDQYTSIAQIDTTNTGTTNIGVAVKLFSNILEKQVPEYIYDTWTTIIDVGVDEYVATYGNIDLVSGSTGGGFTSPETGITFLNVNISDPDGGIVNCSSCIDF